MTGCESRVRANGYGMRDLIDIRYTGGGESRWTVRQTERQTDRKRERGVGVGTPDTRVDSCWLRAVTVDARTARALTKINHHKDCGHKARRRKAISDPPDTDSRQ